ncbi:uncharacterized protein PAC_01179 [Phialocephala subalpina]|uniref:Wax synthase domain-containing protein n=1 Tax=Phialocephala subalpina TaxID=576137 RepID=A0A1L7WEV2_9HELO|nr:uncharacterized protein PAC_01179 [Phialocephala subalpina]
MVNASSQLLKAACSTADSPHLWSSPPLYNSLFSFPSIWTLQRSNMASLFPHLSATGAPPTSREVMNAYHSAFSARVADGSLRPLVIPYHLYGYLLLIIYLCIPHWRRPWVYAARWPVLGIIGWWQWKTLWEATSMSMATGFAAGLTAVWGIVWAVTWLVLNDPQNEAKRVQGRWVKAENVGLGGDDSESTNGHAKEDTSGRTSSATITSDGTIERKRQTQNGGTSGTREANGHAVGNGKAHGKMQEKYNKEGIVAEYYWQAYPEKLSQRISWVLDLIANFRGPGWNWAIPPLPSPPPSIMGQLSHGHVDASSKSGRSSIGLQRYDTRSALIRRRVPQFIIGYFLLDILKVLMMHDPYYIFGPTTYRLPSYLQGLSPLSLRFIRQTISSFAIMISLEMVFLLAPIIFSLLLGPKVLGVWGEPWMYPTTWGSWSKVMNKGLNGLWGSWWHQTFRFAFSAPSNFLIEKGYINPKSAAARVAAMVFAFGISGIIHTGGSISQFPKTYPWHAPIFFMLQAVGILVQTVASSALHPLIKQMPRSVRQGGNFLFVFGWMFWTGWWLTDDFARGGIWLYEPIPISPLRGLGFGEKDAGWGCWEHLGVGWFKGKHWWESGIAI